MYKTQAYQCLYKNDFKKPSACCGWHTSGLKYIHKSRYSMSVYIYHKIIRFYVPVSLKLRQFVIVPKSLLALQQNALNPLMSSSVKVIVLDDTVLRLLVECVGVVARSVLSVLLFAVICSQLMFD